ncbi:hypothetical protein VOLCADRAFT_121319, partial [Volvox carteri f. nagariensis]
MSIDIKELQAELVCSRKKVSEWSASRVQFMTELKDLHATLLRDQTEKINNLQGVKAQLQVQAGQISKRLQDEEEEAVRTEERLAGTKAEESTLKRRLEAAQVHLRKRQEVYRQQLEGMESVNKERQQQLDNLRQQSALFGERFGLHFRTRVPGEFTVVMTCIDARDPDKEFCVAVRMALGDVYTVTKCEPLVPDLDELVDQVNRTNDFGAFVKASSVEFVEGISKEEAAKFERIAASLVARLNDVQDYVEEDYNDDGDDSLVPFGASPEEIAARQACIAQRRSGGVTGSSSSSSGGDSGALRLADGPNGYVPRSKRRRQIPDENLPK